MSARFCADHARAHVGRTLRVPMKRGAHTGAHIKHVSPHGPKKGPCGHALVLVMCACLRACVLEWLPACMPAPLRLLVCARGHACVPAWIAATRACALARRRLLRLRARRRARPAARAPAHARARAEEACARGPAGARVCSRAHAIAIDCPCASLPDCGAKAQSPWGDPLRALRLSPTRKPP